MEAIKRHKGFFKFTAAVITPISKILFNYDYEKLKSVPEPYLLLSNHNSDCDCGLLLIAARNQLSFVATENMERMGLAGVLIRKFYNPILHYKGMPGIRTVKTILKHLKAGFNVAMFPEGNRSFNGRTCPIPPGTGNLARSCGVTVVTYRLTGGYFSSPRWGRKIRKGKVVGRIAGVYSPSELKSMSVEEVNSIIERDLYVDAYEDQKAQPVAFKGKAAAEGMESTLFLCPDCQRIGTLKTEDNRLFCDCGFEAIYDEYGYLQKKDGSTLTITDLDVSQKAFIGELYKNNTDEIFFSDEAVMEIIDEDHEVVEHKKVSLMALKDRFVAGDTQILYDSIEGIAINQRNLLLIHIIGQKSHYEFSGPDSFNALKYLYLERCTGASRNGIL